MVLQLQHNNESAMFYDLSYKNSLSNFYIGTKAQTLKIQFPKELISKIKQISFKKMDFYVRVFILHCFIFSVNIFLKMFPSKHKIKGRLLFKSSLTFKKGSLLQVINSYDYFYSQTFYYNYLFSTVIKLLFKHFFKIKKKHIFFFKLVKI